jgi:hypothetical protein
LALNGYARRSVTLQGLSQIGTDILLPAMMSYLFRRVVPLKIRNLKRGYSFVHQK